MNANVQEQIDVLEERTGSLEKILGQFISSTNMLMIRREADTQQLKEEMKEFKSSMDRLMLRQEADTQKLKEEMKEFKNEMKEFKEEMKEFKNDIRADTENFKKRTEADHRRFREEMGRLSIKMGTLVEDMVAPNIQGIAYVYFKDSDFSSFSVRNTRRNLRNPSVRREFDVVAVGECHFFINETKSKPRPEDVKDFADVLKELPDYFPESRDKKIIPIFASLYIPENICKHLTGYGIYGMGMKGDTMELLNFKEVREK